MNNYERYLADRERIVAKAEAEIERKAAERIKAGRKREIKARRTETERMWQRREQSARHYRAHREQYLMRAKARRAAAPGRVSEEKRRYNEAHREQAAAYHRTWRAAHREELAAARKHRVAVDPEGVRLKRRKDYLRYREAALVRQREYSAVRQSVGDCPDKEIRAVAAKLYYLRKEIRTQQRA